MKVIIAGSRLITSWKVVEDAWGRSGFCITKLVSGGAIGVDQAAEWLCKKRGIPIKHFLPDYKTYGKGAPIRRNMQMADYADALIAVWNGKSKGTEHMIDCIWTLRKKLYIYYLETK